MSYENTAVNRPAGDLVGQGVHRILSTLPGLAIPAAVLPALGRREVRTSRGRMSSRTLIDLPRNTPNFKQRRICDSCYAAAVHCPALGHGLASGDVRFRPSPGPTVSRSSMSALSADPHPDHEIVTLILRVKGASGRVRKLRVYGCKVVIKQAGADRLRYLV